MSESENMEELLEVAERDPHLSVVLEDAFESDSLVGRVLMVNRGQLFPSSEQPHFELKLIFWDNYELKETPEKSVIAVEERLRKSESKQAPVRNLEELLRDMRDLVIYYLLRGIRTNEKLKLLVNIQDFNFVTMKQTLRDYGSLAETLQAITDELSDAKSIPDENVRSTIEKLKFGFIGEAMAQMLRSSSVLAYSTQALPLWGHPVKQGLVACQGLTNEEYTGAINYLYMLDLFEGCQSVFWCESCRDVRQVFWSLSMTDPSHANMVCLRCHNPMLAALAYRPKESLLRCIAFKDGFLTVALAYLLKKRNIRYEYSVKGAHEKDFICQAKSGRILLECKMHRTDANDRGISDALKRDIAQLVEHSKAPPGEREPVVRAFLICNYPTDIVRRFSEPLLGDVKREGTPPLSVISYEEVKDLLKELEEGSMRPN